jgi:cytochrome P450
MPWVRGYEEAAKLLNDPRLKTDYISLFQAAGANQGLAGEAGRRSLLNLHGQEHKRLRSEIAPEFRPRAVDRVRPFARSAAQELMRTFPDAQAFDFMRDFATPYIEQTTAHFLGIPVDDMSLLTGPLAQMSEAVLDLRSRARDFDEGAEQMVTYAMKSLQARRDNPTDDVIGRLTEMVTAGAIDELFAANLVGTVLSAGLEPTILQLGLIIEELGLRPDIWDGLAEDPSRVPGVLEELLRYRSTNPGVVRCFEEDVTQRGVTFEKGSQVHISIAGANHDARRYGRPEEFDVGANSGSHMAFGFGPHHCLGAPLVRVQMQEALYALTPALRPPVTVKTKKKEGQGLAGPVRLVIETTRRGQD